MMAERAVVLGAHVTQAAEHADRGIPRFVTDHVQALARRAPELLAQVDLDAQRCLPPALDRWLGGVRIGYDSGAVMAGRRALYHLMGPFEHLPLDRIWPAWARGPHVGLVVTLYDLIPLLYPHQYLTTAEARLFYRARLEVVRAADAVLAISCTTARDAVRLLGVDPKRLVNISAGCSPFFRPPRRARASIAADLRAQFPAIQEGFVLCTSGLDPRKNIEGLIAGYAKLPVPIRMQRPLVVACRMPPTAERPLRDLATSLAVNHQLLFTGYVTDEILRSLYQACGVFVFPSFYEGFGLPVLEAMSCGAPAIVSDTPTLAELVPDREARFDPGSPAGLRNTLLRVIGDAQFESRLRTQAATTAAAFSWDAVADRTILAYDQVFAGLERRTSAPRPRWAVFSPMPPLETGVADYDARLWRALAEFCDLDVFVDGDPADYEDPAHPRVRLYGAGQFEWRRRIMPFDRVVYSMGNSGFHARAWETLLRHPGDVLLHDVCVIHLYGALDEAGRQAPGFFDRKFRSMYGDRLPPELAATGSIAPMASEVAARLGVFMAREVLSHARTVMVPTRAARQIAILEAPEAAHRVHVVPLALPEPKARPLPAGPPVISTFGIVDESKAASLIVDAFAELARWIPAARLVFAGAAHPILIGRLLARARARGVDDHVELTGRLSADRYLERLEQTTVALQLRRITHGEMSGSVGDCLAAGIPTVVSDIGGLAELPRDSVVHVPVGIDAIGLARTIAGLLADAERRRMLAEAAIAYAETHGAKHSAAEIWRLLRSPSGAERAAPHAVAPDPSSTSASVLRRTAPPVAIRRARGRRPDGRRAGKSGGRVRHLVRAGRGIEFVMVLDRAARDPISVACATGRLSDSLVDLMLDVVRPGYRVLDVGAHVGSFSLSAAAAGCDVVAVEASAENADLLRESVVRNGFHRLQVIHAAAADRRGQVGFWPLGPWGHIATAEMPTSLMVPAVRLEETLAEIGWDRVDFVKIDVEGSELAALRGLRRPLTDPNPPILLLEANAHTLWRFELTPDDLLRELEALGYRSFSVEEGRLVPVQSGTLQPTLLVDYLAAARPVDRLGAWHIHPAPTVEDLIARAAAECQHTSEEHRLWIARALARADPALLAHPAIGAGLRALRHDPVTSVRDACSWYAPPA